jgi:ADP-ribosylarginine hydrolase
MNRQDNDRDNNKKADTNVVPSLILHALGDTIGFKNGEWEFNFGESRSDIILDYVNEMIYQFIDLGGVNSIDLSDWIVSDDTIFQLYVGKSMLRYQGKVDNTFIQITKGYLSTALTKSIEKESEGVLRYPGHTTGFSITRFTPDHDARHEEYEMRAGGNGCAMRNLVIGICLHHEEQLDELIDVSVITSQLTHNNAFGYLGGFTTAFFAALAIRKVDILTWPYLLLEQLKSDKMVSFIHKTVSQETRDYMDYIMYWEKHIDNRFDKNRNLLEIKAFTNPMYRIKYYFDQFMVGTRANMIGDAGYLATIMAYDALVDSRGVWEKLIVYGMLHVGDSDTVGAITAGLYGALHGFGDVPENMYSTLEFRKDIEKLGKDIEKKYY